MSETNLIIPPNIGDVYITPYKSYVALITNSGEIAPTAIVLNSNDSNYLGDIVWTRISAGSYYGATPVVIPYSKTFVTISGVGGGALFFAGNNTGLDPDPELSTTVYILTTGVDEVNSDYLLTNTPIEIRLYP
jgi:hypothetical protein